MNAIIDEILKEIEVYPIGNFHDTEEFHRIYLAKKGRITALFDDFKELPSGQKPLVGKLLNQLKTVAQERLDAARDTFAVKKESAAPPDLSLPAFGVCTGSVHPVTQMINEIVGVFEKIGFAVAEGPEIEDDWHNFTALNFEPNHPAREMQDTFFLARTPDYLLRTHTSTVQIRSMEKYKPPIRILAPGRVYRNEAISARSHCFFHQVEGLYIDEGVSFADLKQALEFFIAAFFGRDVKTRLRASYFPFTEMSAELDVSCLLCKGEGCNVCKHTGWVEVLGCGMIDPNVLENCNIDPDKYSGYAFGMGVERTALIRYRIPDIRLYDQNDVRFLHNFSFLN